MLWGWRVGHWIGDCCAFGGKESEKGENEAEGKMWTTFKHETSIRFMIINWEINWQLLR